MSGLCTVDFHTHLNWQSPLAVSGSIIRIVSTPLAHINDPVPENTVQTLELHPWDGIVFSELFAQTCPNNRFAGIGEVGLDRLKGALPMAQQQEIFEAAAHLAQSLRKPLTVHCVKAFSELLNSYKKIRWDVPTIIHYFRGNLALAQQLWEHTDFILSLPPAVFTQPKLLDHLRSNHALLNRIVLETDDPDSGDIDRHYRNMAQALDMDFTALQKIMFEQYLRLYNGK